VSNLGRSLWAQPEQSLAITRETVSAVTVLDKDPTLAAERAAQALLERANRHGMYARVPTGFNALFPEERFILLALHQGRWSYERTARVVGESVESLQQLAWNARVYLALSHYPSAPKQASVSCPDYNPQRPWTQRFLDEELEGREKTFLQAHLAGCKDCREALVRAKDVYYKVQQQLEAMESKHAHPGFTAQLQTLVEEGRKLNAGGVDSSAAGALRSLWSRWDVKLVFLAWVVALVWLKFKN
jgi:hypothetical protein